MYARFLDEALAVFAGAYHVGVGVADRGRHVNVLEVEFVDLDAGHVAVQSLLQHALGFDADGFPLRTLKNGVEPVGAHRFPQGALSRLLDGEFGIANLEQEILCRRDAVLNLVDELDQVFVLGQHVAAIFQ